jgi:hypothetical protein
MFPIDNLRIFLRASFINRDSITYVGGSLYWSSKNGLQPDQYGGLHLTTYMFIRFIEGKFVLGNLRISYLEYLKYLGIDNCLVPI